MFPLFTVCLTTTDIIIYIHKTTDAFLAKLKQYQFWWNHKNLNDLPFYCHKPTHGWAHPHSCYRGRRMQSILSLCKKTFCNWRVRCPEKLSPCSHIYDIRWSYPSHFMPPHHIWHHLMDFWGELKYCYFYYHLPIGDGSQLIVLCDEWFSHSFFYIKGDNSDLVAHFQNSNLQRWGAEIRGVRPTPN